MSNSSTLSSLGHFIFAIFFLGHHQSPKLVAGGVLPLCSCTSGHHHHFGGGFWSPQWSSGHHLGSCELPSYQAWYFDLRFDLETTGTHLIWLLKAVPFSASVTKISKCLFVLIELISACLYIILFIPFHITCTYLYLPFVSTVWLIRSLFWGLNSNS